MRSKRKPLKSRGGKRVGDPGTTGGAIGAARAVERMSAVQPRSHHARIRARTAAPPVIGDDQFIQNFFYWAFLRYPNSTELAYWNDILRTAYGQGQSAMLAAMRELGMTVFESAEYAARNRSNHDYVYDLYKTFLMREPDSGGWAYWESVVPQIGRENVRHGFEYSVEFSNLVASVTPNGAASGNAASLLTARVDPNNQTGDQLLARDCEWSVGLLNLPGRAGLDLGLGLSYSSLVWTRSGPYLYFDQDNGSPSPGFRLGFATIQGALFDAQVGRNIYMLITSSGHRVELRQVGTSNVYEASDSSYLQLIDNGGSLLVRTDGTQLTYLWFENEWRATQLKDRHGNYLTVNYDSHADITNITDTLGRVITFNYDANANPVSITQSWNGQTHTWATFGWGTLTMQLGFSGVSVVGAYNGEAMPVLTQVGLGDGSFFTFQYTGAGQVNLIRSYAPNSAQRSYVAYDYAPATDNCPRISQARVWAQDWTGVNGVPAEVVTQYSEPGDGSHQLVAPDGTVYKEFYGGTGVSPVWQRGLVLQTEVWSGGVRQKWTTTAWTQDNTSVSYQTNPRVTEANIYDLAGNRNRTTMSYTAFTLPSGASCSLPSDAYQYAADAATVLRRSHTDYNLSSTYLDRRIIGLAASQTLFDGANNLMARTDLQYDEAGSIQNQGAPTQHDDANYGSGFVAGRANVSSARRYNVINSGQWTVSSVQYNTAGAVVTAIDAAGHQSTIGYTDSFSDGVNRNTFAYASSTQPLRPVTTTCKGMET
jgi:YD repeat-containing protein